MIGSNRGVQITYIAGSERSGTTLIDQLLGTYPGFFSAGELIWIWRNSVLRDWICACGEVFSACPFWASVRRHDPDLFTRHTATEISDYQTRLFRNRLMYRLWVGGRLKGPVGPRHRQYLDRLARLYVAIGNATGGSNIVDSSKNPIYLQSLLESGVASTLELLHVVRDPRGVAFSAMQRRVNPGSPGGKDYIGPAPPALVATLWLEWNATIERVGSALGSRYRRVRYEDFVVDPAAYLNQFGTQPRVNPSAPPTATNDRTVWHTVAGNPARFRDGPIVVRPDERWIHKMRADDVRRVTLITWPLLMRYGYALRARRNIRT